MPMDPEPPHNADEREQDKEEDDLPETKVISRIRTHAKQIG